MTVEMSVIEHMGFFVTKELLLHKHFKETEASNGLFLCQ